MTPNVRRLREDERAEAIRTLVLAFDADPFFRYLCPDHHNRDGWTRWFHTLALGECASRDGLYTLDDGPQKGLIALVPPGGWPVATSASLRSIPFPTRRPTRRLVVTGLWMMAQMGRVHLRAPHLYVYVLGVNPAHQGRGFGGVLLRHALGMARAAGVPAYLETANPANLPLYQKFGFRIVETLQRADSPPLWTMVTPSPPA